MFSYSITMGLYTMNYFEDLKRREKVVELMKKDDWRGVVEEFQVCKQSHSHKLITIPYQGTDEYRDPLLVWIRPTFHCLHFLSECVTQLGLSAISSIGCGCGTLEWLIQSVTELTVTGYEVNRTWLEGDHAIPHFINIGK